MAVIIYRDYAGTGTLKPYAAISDSGKVYTHNAWIGDIIEGLEEPEIVARFSNGNFSAQVYNNNVAKAIWKKWGRNYNG